MLFIPSIFQHSMASLQQLVSVLNVKVDVFFLEVFCLMFVCSLINN